MKGIFLAIYDIHARRKNFYNKRLDIQYLNVEDVCMLIYIYKCPYTDDKI